MDLAQERALVERAKTDPEAFGELYDDHYSRIFGYVLRRTANVEVAEDVTSEVFFKALDKLGQFRWRGIPFSAWLYRIAAREIATSFRKRHRQQTVLREYYDSTAVADPSAEDELVRAEAELLRHRQYLALHENVARLPPKYQEVIALRFFEGKQIREIGEILGRREGTVKSLLHRGIEKLRRRME